MVDIFIQKIIIYSIVIVKDILKIYLYIYIYIYCVLYAVMRYMLLYFKNESNKMEYSAPHRTY